MSDNGLVTAPEGTAAELAENLRRRRPDRRRPRRQATAEATLTAAGSGKLLAHGVSTCMILGEG